MYSRLFTIIVQSVIQLAPVRIDVHKVPVRSAIRILTLVPESSIHKANRSLRNEITNNRRTHNFISIFIHQPALEIPGKKTGIYRIITRSLKHPPVPRRSISAKDNSSDSRTGGCKRSPLFSTTRHRRTHLPLARGWIEPGDRQRAGESERGRETRRADDQPRFTAASD